MGYRPSNPRTPSETVRRGSVIHGEPSSFYYRQVYSCFFKDPVGVTLLDQVGRDNICFEVDYPHQDSTWPDTEAVAMKTFGHLPPDDVCKIARGNAIRLLGLDLE